jgi:hypothetical protein
MDEPANKPEQNANQPSSKQEWAGLAEIDQAISENRLTEYRFRKAWADPWSRSVTIVLMCVIALFAIYVLVDEFIG